MANAFSTKATLASGRTLVMDATLSNAMTLISMVLSGDLAVEWELYLDRDISTLAVGTVSLSDSGSGGTITANTNVYVRVTAVDALGKESPPSASVLKKTGAGNTHTITATWTAVTDAVSYNIYTSTKSGQETLYLAGAVSPQAITDMPVNRSLGLLTAPDIHIIAPVGVVPIPVLGAPLFERLVVYAKVSSGGAVSISCLAQ